MFSETSGSSNHIEIIDIIEKNLKILYQSTNSSERWDSQKILTDIQNSSEVLERVPLLIKSNDSNLIFFGLQILEKIVLFKWQSISSKDKEKILCFIWDLVSNKYLKPKNDQTNDFNFTKINILLVQVILNSNEEYFYFFLENLTNSAEISESICYNNFLIISILLEELSDKSNNLIKNKILKNQFKLITQLKRIDNMCRFILQQNIFFLDRQTLLLNLVLKILCYTKEFYIGDWIIEKKIVNSVIFLCFKPVTRDQALNLIIELNKTPQKIVMMFTVKFIENFILHIQEILPFSENYGELFKISDSESKDYILKISLIFLVFFKNYIKIKNFFLISTGLLMKINQFMLKITCLPQIEIFKIALEWWGVFLLNDEFLTHFYFLKEFFAKILLDMIVLIVVRMAKPEEVLIREDENGQIIKVSLRDTETFELHERLKNILINITKKNPKLFKKVILEKLAFQSKKKYWNRKILNSICWSVGATTGIFGEEEEKNFIITIIKDLLYLCDTKKGKDNKAVIASNIMFIVGQYPRFLKAHWKFLKTVINKLFEFMQEIHPGIQDMACDTFQKICKDCYSVILVNEISQDKFLLEYIFESLTVVKKFDEFRHIEQFLNVVGFLISKLNTVVNLQKYTEKIFKFINKDFDFGSLSETFLKNKRYLDQLLKLLILHKNFVLLLKEKCPLYYLGLLAEMIHIYNIIENFLKKDNLGYPCVIFDKLHLKKLKLVRKEIIALGSAIVTKPSPQSNELIFKRKNSIFIDPFLLSFSNFQKLHEQEPEILDFGSRILNNRIIANRHDIVVKIFKKIFIPTLNLLKNSYEKFYDFRISFFRLLKVLIEKNFNLLFNLDEEPEEAEKYFVMIIHSLVWGFKHPCFSISFLAANLFEIFFLRIEQTNQEKYFYSNYFSYLFNDLTICLIGGEHFFGIKKIVSMLLFLNEKSKEIWKKDEMYKYFKNLFKNFFEGIFNEVLYEMMRLLLSNYIFPDSNEKFSHLVKTYLDFEEESLSDN